MTQNGGRGRNQVTGASPQPRTPCLPTYAAGPRSAVAEPVFVPRSRGAAEGDGYLLTNIFDEDRNASHLAIFDAQEIERGPIARAHLDHRVPVGFHGQWKPRDAAA